MPPVYLLTAAQCPVIQVPSGLLKSTDDPTVAEKLVPGTQANDALSGTVLLNRNATRLDQLGRYGGGAYGVRAGLDFANGGGLTLRVNDGIIGLDTPEELIGGGGLGYSTLALTDGIYASGNVAVRTWIWLSRAGTLTQVISSLAVPAGGPWLLLGSVRTNAGIIVDWDFSGRLEAGPVLYRRTADFGAPTDAPPAGLRFWTETLGGFYFWNGAAYLGPGSGLPANTSLLSLLATFEDLLEAREADQRAFRRLLFFVADAFKKIPPGLETQFQLATRER